MADGLSDAGEPEPDDVLAGLIHRADLDGLVRLVDDCCATRDWSRLRRLRDEARHAVGTGRQLWPAATLAEYRLALLAPAPWAAGVLDEGSGRFTIGPLTEVVAEHHTWAELAPLLEPGPRAAIVAHERALRGERIEPTTTAGLPDVLELPYAIADWEPSYPLATYTDDGGEFPAPDGPGPLSDVSAPGHAAAPARRRRRRAGRASARRGVDGDVQRARRRGRRRRVTRPGRCGRWAWPEPGGRR